MFGNKKNKQKKEETDVEFVIKNSMKKSLENENSFPENLPKKNDKIEFQKTELPKEKILPFNQKENTPQSYQPHSKDQIRQEKTEPTKKQIEMKKPLDKKESEKIFTNYFPTPEKKLPEKISPEKENSFPSKPYSSTIQDNFTKKPANPITPKKDYSALLDKKINAEKTTEKQSNSANSFFLIIIMIVSTIAVASGFYYYFFIINKPGQIISPEPEKKPEEVFPVNPEPPVIEPEFPAILTNAEEIILSNGKNLRENILSNENLPSGFYSIKDETGNLSFDNFFTMTGINIFQEIFPQPTNLWIYYNSVSSEIALLTGFEKQTFSEIEVKNQLLAKEEVFLKTFSTLYPTPIDEIPQEKVIFQDSLENQGFRYFNFKTSDEKTFSLDWGFAKNVLIFTTTKENATNIINLLQTDEVDLQINGQIDNLQNEAIVGEINETELEKEIFNADNTVKSPF